MNRCISVRFYPRRVKTLNFENFDNSHKSFLWPEYFIDFYVKDMDPMSGFDIRLVFALAPRDSKLQYKRWVHLWNNFPCIVTLGWYISRKVSINMVDIYIYRYFSYYGWYISTDASFTSMFVKYLQKCLLV